MGIKQLITIGVVCVEHSSKTMDHLLIHCIVAHKLWAFIFAMFRVQWGRPKRVTDVLFDWHS